MGEGSVMVERRRIPEPDEVTDLPRPRMRELRAAWRKRTPICEMHFKTLAQAEHWRLARWHCCVLQPSEYIRNSGGTVCWRVEVCWSCTRHRDVAGHEWSGPYKKIAESDVREFVMTARSRTLLVEEVAELVRCGRCVRSRCEKHGARWFVYVVACVGCAKKDRYGLHVELEPLLLPPLRGPKGEGI